MHSADTPAADKRPFDRQTEPKHTRFALQNSDEILARKTQTRFCFAKLGQDFASQNSDNAGWSSPVARQAHNLKAAGSNPAPATKHIHTHTHQKARSSGPFGVWGKPSDRAGAPRTVLPAAE